MDHCQGKPVRRFRHVLLFLSVVMMTMLAPVTVRAVQSEPAQVITRFNAALLEAMKRSDELGYKGRYSLLAPVVRDAFALDATARVSAGRYWSTFTEVERKELLARYADWSIATYAGRFDGYSGEQFRVASESFPKEGAATVVSKLIVPDGDDVEFHYELRKTQGAWRIVDIRIAGVSQLAMTRSQFVDIIAKRGVRGLISTLNDKIQTLSQGKRE